MLVLDISPSIYYTFRTYSMKSFISPSIYYTFRTCSMKFNLKILKFQY